MPRLVFAGILAVLLLGYATYAAFTTWVIPSNAALKGRCDSWLEKPQAQWIALKGCVLDVDLVILESEEGDFETLQNRNEGISSKPYPVPPNWVAVWIPIRTEFKSASLVRAAYRLDSKDALKWVNEFERADEKKKEKMWADPAPIRRLSRPGVLPGKAEKPSNEAIVKTFGPRASANLLAVIAGDPPPMDPPVVGILSGILGLVALGYVLRRRPAGDDLTAEQLITNVNVSDVKLEIGALEQLRLEEEEERRKKRNQ